MGSKTDIASTGGVMITRHFNINGLDIEARYSESTVENIFLPFLQKLTGLQKEKGRRILVMLAAPPGAGKSTLLSFLEQLARENEELKEIQTIGIDGFHRQQDYLLTHTTIRNGEEIPMVRIKGAPITFDLEKLAERIQRVAAGENCGWPVYDRLLHNPIEDVIRVDGDIVLLEGNYLLLDEDGWRDLSKYADYTVSLVADEELLRTRLIERRIKTGVSEEDSRKFVDYSDMVNVRTCLQNSKPADLTLKICPDDDYIQV